MSKFCVNVCDSLLTPFYVNDQASFKCNVCHSIYKFSDDDSLRYSNVKENEIIIHKKLLDNSIKDPAGLKVDNIKCINCPSRDITQVRIGKDMTLFNICIKCEKKWLN